MIRDILYDACGVLYAVTLAWVAWRRYNEIGDRYEFATVLVVFGMFWYAQGENPRITATGAVWPALQECGLVELFLFLPVWLWTTKKRARPVKAPPVEHDEEHAV